MSKRNQEGPRKSATNNLSELGRSTSTSVSKRLIPSLSATKMAMPEGSGAVVLYAKSNGKLRTMEVTALKAVSSETGRNEIWTIIENILMPHQISFETGENQTVWLDLKKFRAYRERLPLMKKTGR